MSGGPGYQKNGINPSRDVKNNTDMRAAGGGPPQSSNVMRWQYGAKQNARGQDQHTIDVIGGGKAGGEHELASGNAGGGLYTQVNSPMYNKQNYPGIPKTTTNR